MRKYEKIKIFISLLIILLLYNCQKKAMVFSDKEKIPVYEWSSVKDSIKNARSSKILLHTCDSAAKCTT